MYKLYKKYSSAQICKIIKESSVVPYIFSTTFK